MPKQRRLGCLPRFILYLVLGMVAIALITALFAPWGFFLGGRFHILPVWQGIGRMHASSGDFVLYLWISPTSSGRTYNYPAFNGWGTLCTPRGEQFKLRVTGGMHERTGIDSNGKAMRISLHRRPWYYGLTGTWDSRPRLELRGRWQNPDLVMDDGGSLSRAFLPDGRLYQGPPRNQPAAREKLELVLHETGWLGFVSGCRAEAK
jgi:hypothetical protein